VSNVLKKYEWLWHLLFWGLFLLLMTLIFARFLGFQQALIRNLANCLVFAPLVYFNLYFLVDRYLFKEKYFAYAGIIVVLIVVSSPIRAYIDNMFRFNANNPLLMFSVAHYGTIVLSSIIMLGVTTTLKLLEEWYEKKEIAADLTRLKLEAELKFLKAQVNPHFLFNVLNNIYTLTYLEGKAAAPQVLKLSGLMRYMLYESNETLVPLNKEIEYINNYLDLQQLKNDNRAQVVFEVSGDTNQIKVAPLLFIPFFENAFKHGDVLNTSEGSLTSSIHISQHTLQFKIQNTFADNDRKDHVGGIGLENVRKRLALLYPDKHVLDIVSINNIFTVHLTIEIL
jgi:two-component system, LytTR family, sensor kinase